MLFQFERGTMESRGKKILALALSKNKEVTIVQKLENLERDENSFYEELKPVALLETLLSSPVLRNHDSGSYAELQPVAILERLPSTHQDHALSDFDSDDSVQDPDFEYEDLEDDEGSEDKDIPPEAVQETNVDVNADEVVVEYTKKGTIRKRKRLMDSLSARKAKKIENIKLNHSVKPSCNNQYKKNATITLTKIVE